MQVAYCEKCGRRLMIRDPGAWREKHLLCKDCRSEVPEEQSADTRRNTPGPAEIRRQPPASQQQPSSSETQAPADEDAARFSFRPYLLAVSAVGFLLFLGLLAAYIIWGRGYREGALLASQGMPADLAPEQPDVQSNRSSPADSPPPDAEAAREKPDEGAAQSGKSTEEIDKPAERKPIGGWGAAGVPGTSTDVSTDIASSETTPNAASDGTADATPVAPTSQEGEEKVDTASALGETGTTEEQAAQPAQPAAPEPEAIREIPRMPEAVAQAVVRAAELHTRYEILDTVASLCGRYRFAQALERLEKHTEGDELWSTAAGEVKKAGEVMTRIEDALRGLQGKEIDVRMTGGRQTGTVRGYSSGMIMIQTSAGYPSGLSLKMVPHDTLRQWIKGVAEGDFLLFSIYSGRGLPEGTDQKGFSEPALLMLEYAEWSAREKEAAAALKRLRELREKEEWAELIGASVENARGFMGTYAVGVAGRGEIGGMLKEALTKKKKTIVYQAGLSPSPDYDGVADTHISQYGKGYELTSHMNELARSYGASKDLRMYSNSRSTLIRFELEGLPEDVKLHKATMEIYCSKLVYETKAILKAYLLAEEWVEGTGGFKAKSGASWEFRDGYDSKRWSTPGGTIVEQEFGLNETGLVGTAEAEAGKWMTMDVTPGVNAWLTKQTPNYGVILRFGKRSADIWWVSSETPDPANHPRLILEYEGTVKGQEAVVPEDLQWLLYEEGGGGDTKVEGIDI